MPCPTAPACWPVLTQPEVILQDHRRWPKHLCVDMLEQAAARWFDQAIVLPRGRLLPTWPIPVGRHLASNEHWWTDDWQALPTNQVVPQMPFDGDELALLAVRLPLADGVV